jgi:hypothetical protein
LFHPPATVSLHKQAVTATQREERLREKGKEGAVLAGGGSEPNKRLAKVFRSPEAEFLDEILRAFLLAIHSHLCKHCKRKPQPENSQDYAQKLLYIHEFGFSTVSVFILLYTVINNTTILIGIGLHDPSDCQSHRRLPSPQWRIFSPLWNSFQLPHRRRQNPRRRIPPL